MMLMGDEPPKQRGRHRTKVEGDMIRKRERDFRHQQMWTGAQDYYKRWNDVNTKFDEWTSPRYYEDNNKMISDLRQKKDKEELLEKRREKLRKQLEQEENTYQIELMVSQNLKIQQKPFTEEIPTKLLKDVNSEIKLKENEAKKREAELKLYHQWRNNNPVVRQIESRYRWKDLKLTWLDQQIEKRMEKEREEKENKRIIKEQEERLKFEKEQEQKFEKKIREKQVELKEQLDKQIEDLKSKQIISNELKCKELEELKYKDQFDELIKKSELEEKRRLAKENALYNLRQHKLKLKQKALDVQEALEKDKELILQMKKLELQEIMEDERKKTEIKTALSKFLIIVKEQQELEKQRQKHLEFLFDSEVKAIYEKQLAMWKKEECARKALFKDVLDTVNKQIQENIEKNKQAQRELICEREQMLNKVEQYNQELKNLRVEENEKKKQRKQTIDEDVRVQNARKRQEENKKLKEIDDELNRVKKEEERLHREIMEIQKKQGPLRPRVRRKFLY
ncbi:unnamed protein product [Ceutorhynchus assimilis]|uniref:Trichoplein keratin filament-binding protein n=1 Tax=Ceutorhynchus assimilis TaxID=467358 RepID=A0A9N9MSS3_9CUCU|nr:unnamed protein product [Ceutorhynchus assimilis]